MGIYLPNMEMPRKNDYTIAIVYGDGVVTEYHEDYWIRGADGEKQLGIAVPVPPHGRLIDADDFLELCSAYAVTPSDDEFCKRLEYALTRAATIIPASEGGE